MNFWNQYPILRILIPLIIGILVAYYSSSTTLSFFFLLSVLFVFIAWIFFLRKLLNFRGRYLGSFLIGILFLLIGFFLLKSQQQHLNHLHYSKVTDISHFIVRIDAPFSSTQKTHKTIGKIIGVKSKSDSNITSAMGKLLLYFKKQDSIYLTYGDELAINAHNLTPIKNMGNPREFNYKAYLERHQIYDQIYLVNSDWIVTGENRSNLILKWSYQVRESLINILESFNYSEENFAVASAILIGYDAYLDQDLRQLYAGSGAMHILCVSGLHVGIIFLILNVLFKPLEKRKQLKFLKTILIVLIIWFYALITGMSPSVFRAATMFSFISIGQLINRRTSVYNSLAASAVVLILADPFVIFHIGFQLSYSAILGILLIQPIISSWLSFNNLIGKYFWDLLAVSIAAQIGTFPLSIFYFHQFPNYFFLTNLFVIPLSFLILISGIATLFVEITGLSSFLLLSWFKDILDILLSALNKGIDWISQLPFSVSRSLFFSWYDVVLVYLFIIFLIITIILKSKKTLFLCVSVFIILMTYNGILRYNNISKTEKTLILYNIPNNAIMELNVRNTSILFLDSLTFHGNNYSRYLIENTLSNRIKNMEIVFLDSLNKSTSILDVGSWKVFIMGHQTKLPIHHVQVDYLWVRNNPKINANEILNKISPGIVLFDASNNYWNEETWEKACNENEVIFYNLKEKGAFVSKTPF